MDKNLDLKTFDSDDWCELLLKYPKYEKQCDKWHKFTPMQWLHLLSRRKQFILKAKCHINGVIGLICLNSKFAKGFYRWSNLKPKQWGDLLRIRPEFYEKCKSVEVIPKSDWAGIIMKRPELVSEFEKLHKWNDIKRFFGLIIDRQPQFISKLQEIDFNKDDWRRILFFRPHLLKYCDKFQEFKIVDWLCLRSRIPDIKILACKYPEDRKVFF